MSETGAIPPLGSFDSMLGSLDYLKNAWSSFSLPSQFAPTLDVGELDKRITDLKAVEQWLSMNLNMLRGTIQGLEIQRGTIATMAAFSQAFGRTGNAMADLAQRAREATERAAGGAASSGSPGWSPAAQSPADTWAEARRMAENQAPADQEAPQRTEPEGAQPGRGGDPADASETARSAEYTTAPGAPSAGDAKADDAEADNANPDVDARHPFGASANAAGGPPGMGSPFGLPELPVVNPAAWWTLLQQQFSQIAQSALQSGLVDQARSTGPAGSSPSPAPATSEAATNQATHTPKRSATGPSRGAAGQTPKATPRAKSRKSPAGDGAGASSSTSGAPAGLAGTAKKAAGRSAPSPRRVRPSAGVKS